MRVAHVGNYKPDSANGVDKTIAGLVRHLPEQEVQVEVWHLSRKVTRVEEAAVKGTTVFNLPCPASRWQAAVSLPDATRAFLDWRAGQVDWIHLHSVFTPENIQVSRVGRPYVLTPNGGYNPSVLQGRNRLVKALWTPLVERPFANRARVVHAVSQPEVEFLRQMGVTAPTPFIPNGIDQDLLDEPVPPPRAGSAWVFLGRLAVDHKGLDLLIQGYARVCRDSPHEVPPLILAGPDFRGGRRQLEEMCEAFGVRNRVTFPGPVFGPAKLDLLKRARLFFHTSRWEGMPFSVLEAMALGRPVFLTPGTNLAVDVTEARAGWITAATPEAIADGLRQVLDAPSAVLDEAGCRARQVIECRFHWRAIAGQMAALYRRYL